MPILTILIAYTHGEEKCSVRPLDLPVDSNLRLGEVLFAGRSSHYIADIKAPTTKSSHEDPILTYLKLITIIIRSDT